MKSKPKIMSSSSLVLLSGSFYNSKCFCFFYSSYFSYLNFYNFKTINDSFDFSCLPSIVTLSNVFSYVFNSDSLNFMFCTHTPEFFSDGLIFLDMSKGYSSKLFSWLLPKGFVSINKLPTSDSFVYFNVLNGFNYYFNDVFKFRYSSEKKHFSYKWLLHFFLLVRYFIIKPKRFYTRKTSSSFDTFCSSSFYKGFSRFYSFFKYFSYRFGFIKFFTFSFFWTHTSKCSGSEIRKSVHHNCNYSLPLHYNSLFVNYF